MPELPEVETIRRELEPVLVGQTIESVEVLRNKSWSGEVEKVVGKQIVSIGRKGKVLLFKLDSGGSLTPGFSRSGETRAPQSRGYSLMVHLKMTGQLVWRGARQKLKTQNSKLKTKEPAAHLYEGQIVGGHPSNSWNVSLPDKHTRIIFGLSKGKLFFNDQRVFGWVKTASSQDLKSYISNLPPDIIEKECDGEYFYSVLERSGRAVKLVVMDSAKIGGVGNIYANDGLFLAGIDPRRAAASLSRDESERLLAALKEVVNLGIELGGATAGDGKFVNTSGMGGKYQEKFLVYEQEGKVVERDGKRGEVVKFKLGGRGTYWVPELQS